MKQTIRILAVAIVATFALSACGKDNQEETPRQQADTTPEAQPVVEDNIYQFRVVDGNGDSVSLADYRGQVLLVVNTATRCSYTPEYTELQRIYDTYREQGFTILDFPCNQFNGQAPGDYDDIHGFCTETYHITFPQFAPIEVNGPNASPLYVWLKSKRRGDIPWNFTKFLIDREGNVVGRYNTGTSISLMENGIRNSVIEN